ncbi:2OG-Fe(II) oxygenase [Sphingomonas psychrotolerans]|uniref:Proline hydroxylase n=1 Tax=Sphingomonas psychrotolerans TaxID=1327635 RepID=A0A2K8MEY6_9SPHN|nr:2OG-Fe(II) oxygenase [Sphingomonas psychrotolerans]ATY32450.1 proline hydroxylase [Sphingomonas psychrotolerans]
MASNPIEQAHLLASRGQTRPAVVLLEAAGAAGDAQALMQLAVWQLAGTHVARDLDAARVTLRRAVAIGHVDGALMEVALTASGNGNARAPDWQGAIALLDKAAAGDPVATAQRALIGAMALTSDGAPLRVPQGQVISASPRVVHYPALLSERECAHVASVGAGLLEPAQVIDPQTGRLVPHPIRTSDGGAIGPTREDLVIRALNLRIAAISGTRVEQGEPLTVLRYSPGQEYRRHLDTIAGARNQRIRTVLVYLNQGFGGGETQFPMLGLDVRPRGGDAIVFDTILPDGSPDTRTLHAGAPVTAGAKWLATRWIRAEAIDPWTIHAG